MGVTVTAKIADSNAIDNALLKHYDVEPESISD
jgi:hypothetical protein